MNALYDLINLLTDFDKAYEGSFYTITGAGGSLTEYREGYNTALEKAGIGTPKQWYRFSGRQMNERYNLRGDNAYPDDVNFLAFPLDGLNVSKLAAFKLQWQDRWFDDIVNNNAQRGGTK